ncbi:MAG: alpha/beta hydrolase [Candidatus Omnitrophica bacterium]|nr:alpha/beta hydrolase [Candidatus Omnitrophota bacterium]
MIRTLRALYITILIVTVMLILLFIGSFFFLDRTSRKEYVYDIRVNDKVVGTVKIDRFATEDRLTYKAVSNTPYDPVFVESRSKISLNRKYSIESYVQERFTKEGVNLVTSIEAGNKQASYLSRFQSKVLYVDNLPIRKDTFVFIEDSPLTYMPIIENYDFRKGRSQGFNAITPFSPYLPPIKRYVTFTSIRDEYLKIDGRKIKAENLILKIKNYPQYSIWVAKSDRKLLMIELPGTSRKIVRSFRKKNITIKEYAAVPGPVKVRDITFKSKNVQLAGTITSPAQEGKFPALLFMPGYGAYVKDYGYFSESLANYFAKNGFTVMYFYRRGIGGSSGDPNWPSAEDAVQDANAAIDFMLSQPDVDPDRLSLLSHGEGASIASRIAADNKNIRSAVFMAPILYSITDYRSNPDIAKVAAERNKWPTHYAVLVSQAGVDTIDRIRNSKFNWTYISGKRCYIGDMKSRLDKDPLEDINRVVIPVLTVQGKNDESIITESAAHIDNALKRTGNKNSSLIYYGYLGHFFGQPVLDGVHPVRYEVSTEALYSIMKWLNENLPDSKPPEPEPTVPTADDSTGKI